MTLKPLHIYTQEVKGACNRTNVHLQQNVLTETFTATIVLYTFVTQSCCSLRAIHMWFLSPEGVDVPRIMYHLMLLASSVRK